MYKAVIFDSDGTLVDTTRLIIDGFIENLKRHGFTDLATEEHVRRHMGGTVESSLASMLGASTDDQLIQKMVKQQDRIQDELADKTIRPVKGVTETISKLKQNGVKVGLFTGGTLYQIKRNYRVVDLDLDALFDAVVTFDDVQTAKPDPVGLLLCAARLNVDPKEAVYVGDNTIDVQAAKNAGCGSVGVSYGLSNSQQLEQARPDIIVHSLADAAAYILEQRR